MDKCHLFLRYWVLEHISALIIGCISAPDKNSRQYRVDRYKILDNATFFLFYDFEQILEGFYGKTAD